MQILPPMALREPLLHFTLAGALLFALFAWVNDEPPSDLDTLRISAADIERLSSLWARQWGRTPTVEEQRDLIIDYVEERLLAREAMALGLDREDLIVQRRLAQKMRFLVQGTQALAQPGEADLRKFHAQYPERFRAQARLALSQLFFADVAAAEQALETLRQNSAAEVGQPSSLESDIGPLDQGQLSNLFGLSFAEHVVTLEPGGWEGPIASGYGFHLVRINNREPGLLPPFESVRERVLAEWTHEQQAQLERDYMESLREKYQVQIDESLRPLLDTKPLAQVTP